MKRKQLEIFLQELESFERPRLEFEQYATGPQLGADILEAIHYDVGFEESKLLADLGCGCGVLMLGSIKLGTNCAVGFDIDANALRICRQNVIETELRSNCELIQADLTSNDSTISRFYNQFDLIITNPPFGTKNNAGIDLKFIEEAFRLLKPGGHLYSLHKSSTRKFIERKATRDWKSFCSAGECIAELIWNLDKTYFHQKSKSVDIRVDLFRFVKSC